MDENGDSQGDVWPIFRQTQMKAVKMVTDFAERWRKTFRIGILGDSYCSYKTMVIDEYCWPVNVMTLHILDFGETAMATPQLWGKSVGTPTGWYLQRCQSWVIKCPHFSHHPTIRY